MTTRDAEATAKNAEGSTSNDVGMCLQWSRQRANIAALHPDAATAWKHAHNRHPGDRNPPRGAMVYWTGGSKGYGHIAVSLGGGRIRSSDANGNGKPATVGIDWPTQKWGMPYAGWADNVNDTVIPGVSGKDDDDMGYSEWSSSDKKALTNDVAEAVWKKLLQGQDSAPDGRHAAATLSGVRNLTERIAKKVGA